MKRPAAHGIAPEALAWTCRGPFLAARSGFVAAAEESFGFSTRANVIAAAVELKRGPPRRSDA